MRGPVVNGFTQEDRTNAKLPLPPEQDSQAQVLLRPGLLSDVEIQVEKLTDVIHVPSRLTVDLGEAAVAAAVTGAGIARVLSYLIDDLLKSRSLVTLLEAYEPLPIPVSVIYPSQRQVPLKLRAFLDFAVPRLRKKLGYENA